MILDGKSIGVIVLRFIGILGLLGCPAVGSAQGSWSVISALQRPGEVASPAAMAADAAGDLYVADYTGGSFRIQARDAQGNWSVIAGEGTGPGQVSNPAALAADISGNLYVADRNPDRIQKRDAQGHWSVVATAGDALGQIESPSALAADGAGNLYVADVGNSDLDQNGGYLGRIQKRDVLGNWSVLAPQGAFALAVDGADDLYVADAYETGGRIWKRDPHGRWSYLGNTVGSLAVDSAGSLYVASGGIQKRDAQGNWSVLDASHSGLLAADSADNLYVADTGQIQKQDAQGKWSVIASRGSAPGQVLAPSALAVDGAGNVFVADNVGVEERDARGNWSVIAIPGIDLGQVNQVTALAADTAGDLYVAESHYDGSTDTYPSRIQKRDFQGNWSVIATYGDDLGQVDGPTAVAADAAGSLYVAGYGIEKRDVQGNWSVLASARAIALTVDAAGTIYVADGPYSSLINSFYIWEQDAQGSQSQIASAHTGGEYDLRYYSALAVDGAGNLYVGVDHGADTGIQKLDTQGNWSVVATPGSALGQVANPSGLAVDRAGNLYVADSGDDRVLEYVPAP